MTPILGENARQAIFYLMVVGVVAGVLVAYAVGARQDARFSAEYARYQEAVRHLEQGHYAAAKEALEPLLETQGKSYVVQWNYAQALAGLGQYRKARQVFQQVQEMRPFLVKNQAFLLHYGQVLYHLGEREAAKTYLAASREAGKDEEMLRLAEEMLKQLEAL